MSGQVLYNFDIEEYHAHPSISNSGLSLIAKAPRYYQYERFEKPAEEFQEGEKPHFVIGSAYHTLLLEKELFKRRFYALPETYVNKEGEVKPFRKDKRMKHYKDELAKAQGRALLDQTEFHDILGMAEATIKEPAARKYIDMGGVVEASFIWKDEVNEVECRCRPDFIIEKDHTLIDFKTVADASKDAMEKAIYNFGWDRQAYFYTKGYEAVTGNLVNKFVFIVVEKKPPYLVGVYELDQVGIMSGQVRTEALLEVYADCVKRDYWPGLNEGKEAKVSIPSWAAYKMENENTMEGVSA